VSAVCIIDTSVFCNILDVFRREHDHAKSLVELEMMVGAGYTLLLPLATIYETGNHIAQNGDGGRRRKTAERFVTQVRAAFSGDAPWTPTLIPEPADFLAWLDEFPYQAGRGIGMGDLSIIKTWEQQCGLHEARRVFIWSYDGDLQGFDRPPRIR
jgi:hypothetical protein